MPIFDYSAFDDAGKNITGVIDADSPREARDKLRHRRLHVTRMEIMRETGQKRGKGAGFALMSKRRQADVAMVTRQLAVLLRAGINLVEALSVLIDQVKGRRPLETAFRDIRERLTQGATLAEALAFHPAYFDGLFVNMVKAGEAAGALPDVLTRLSDYIQRQARLRSKISAALAYPIMMLLISSGVVVFLMTVVVPKVTAILTSQRKALPLITDIMLTTSTFVTTYWWAILLVLIAIAMLFRAYARTKSGKMRIDTLLLKVPILGDLFRKAAVSRFVVTFSTLLKSGLPALKALEIVRDVVNNEVLRETIDVVREKVLEGGDISAPMKKSTVFPPVVGYMVAVGEESGELENILTQIALSYDEEIEIATAKLTSVIEPIMILAMAGIVGFIVASILLPMLEMSTM